MHWSTSETSGVDRGGGPSHLTASERQAAPSPLVGEGWGGGYLFVSADPNPPPGSRACQVGCFRLGQYARRNRQWPISDGASRPRPQGGGNRSEPRVICNGPALEGEGRCRAKARHRGGVTQLHPHPARVWRRFRKPTPCGGVLNFKNGGPGRLCSP